MSTDLSKAKAITITFLTPVSFASLNGSDKEADNISSIKKLTRETDSGVKEFPYVSSQAIRRALRDQLATMGHSLSGGATAKETKGAATTQCNPTDYLDDDLFGYMDATKSGTRKRTSSVRVSPLVSQDSYQGDLDFGTNYMSVQAGGNPNIFETEIHAGLYRGTVLIELDRVGSGDGFVNDIEENQKAERVEALIDALQNLWSSGRQSRFLADLSPKFVAAAITTVKAPIFLESVQVQGNKVSGSTLDEVLADHKNVVLDSVFGCRTGLFVGTPDNTKTVGDAFSMVKEWVQATFGQSGA